IGQHVEGFGRRGHGLGTMPQTRVGKVQREGPKVPAQGGGWHGRRSPSIYYGIVDTRTAPLLWALAGRAASLPVCPAHTNFYNNFTTLLRCLYDSTQPAWYPLCVSLRQGMTELQLGGEVPYTTCYALRRTTWIHGRPPPLCHSSCSALRSP